MRLEDLFELGGKRFAVIFKEEFVGNAYSEIFEVFAKALGVAEATYNACLLVDKFIARGKVQYFIYNKLHGRISVVTP